MGQEIMEKPIILDENKFTEGDLDSLKKNSNIYKTVDIYEIQLTELFRILHPAMPLNGKEYEQFVSERPKGELAGIWVFYPWSGTLLHCIGKEELFSLRTNRNQLIITKEEQQKLRNAVVGITGMSVGAGMAISLAYSGMSQTIKISDFDALDTSNLNRLRESLSSVGQPKINLAAEHIYNVDPFADVHMFDKGVNMDNINRFFDEPALSLVIDEIDDFRMKVVLRHEAKKRGIPTLMFSSLGDNILIDVERFDTDPSLQIFHGLLGNLPAEILNNENISKQDENRYAVQLVGKEYVPTRALATLKEIGHSLVGRPQLYSTIAVDSGLATYLIRQIILGENIKSGRYFVKFSELFDLPAADLSESEDREAILKRLFA